MRVPVKKQVIIPLVILLVLGAVSLLFYYRSHKGPRELRFSGTVEGP